MLRFLSVFVFMFTVNSFASPAKIDVSDAIKLKVEKYRLDNGMTVLLHEDHGSPIISFQQWYKVGSRDEKPGRTGLAHFFEHLMFKGTKKISGKEFERLIKSNGGSNNAFTTFDYTGYYMNMPSHALELTFKLESDRMRNLLFKMKEIQSEREVVKEERRLRFENSPKGLMQLATFSSVYKVHPYNHSVIGSMADLNAASLQDFKDFYNVYYAPNNTVLVVAGDFKSKQAKKLIEKYYGKIKAQKIPELNAPPEPEQRSQRKVDIKKDVQSPAVTIAYKGVRDGDDDAYALDLLTSILAGGNSSRLHKRMVYWGQKASKVYAYSYTLKDPGMINIHVDLKPGKSINNAVSVVNSEIKKLQTKLVSEKELEKVKNQMMSEYVGALKTVSGKARVLASIEVVHGDYSLLFQDLPKYMAVTREKIREVAKKYLKKERSNLIRLIPEKKTKISKLSN